MIDFQIVYIDPVHIILASSCTMYMYVHDTLP